MTICAAYGCNMDSSIHRINMFLFPKDLKKEKNMDSKFKQGTDCNDEFYSKESLENLF